MTDADSADAVLRARRRASAKARRSASGGSGSSARSMTSTLEVDAVDGKGDVAVRDEDGRVLRHQAVEQAGLRACHCVGVRE
jgi:hypothetical protein